MSWWPNSLQHSLLALDGQGLRSPSSPTSSLPPRPRPGTSISERHTSHLLGVCPPVPTYLPISRTAQRWAASLFSFVDAVQLRWVSLNAWQPVRMLRVSFDGWGTNKRPTFCVTSCSAVDVEWSSTGFFELPRRKVL